MNPELLAWEAEYRSLIPVQRAAYYADGDYTLVRAWTKARPPVPRLVLPPPPAPVWIVRPSGLPAGAVITSTWNGFTVAAPGTEWMRVYRMDGRHQRRDHGRKTHHGRLNIPATRAAYAAYEKAHSSATEDYRRFVARVEEECRTEAIRGGKGWIYGRVGQYGWLGYYIYSPARDAWGPTGGYDQGYVSRAALTILEECPPEVAPLPRMTLAEIVANVESLGFTASPETPSGGRDNWIVVRWAGQHIGILATTPKDPYVTLMGAGGKHYPHTPEGIREWIAHGVQTAQNSLTRRRDEAQAGLDALATFGATP